MTRHRMLGLVLATATCVACTGNRATDGGETEPDVAPAVLECPVFRVADEGLPHSGEWRTRPAVGDVDGDGLDDIVGLSRKGPGPQVFYSDGLGGFEEASAGLTYPSGGISCGYGTRLADLDGDSDLDIAVGDHCKGVWAFENKGERRWEPSAGGIPHNMEGFNDVAVGDLNGDGHVDLVGISAFTRGFLVVHGNGDGTWEWVRDASGLPQVGLGWEVHLADVNGDGRLDILSSFNNASSNRRHDKPPPAKIWLQTAEASFVPAEGFTEDGRWFGVAALGHEERPYLDVYFTLFGYMAGIYRYDTADGLRWVDHGRLDEAWLPALGKAERGYTGISILPVNADVCPDMIFTELRTRKVRVALGNCRERWFLCPEELVPSTTHVGQPWGLGAGDFNADGRVDLTVAYGTTSAGGIAAWLQTAEVRSFDGVGQGHGLVASSEARGSGEPAPTPEP